MMRVLKLETYRATNPKRFENCSHRCGFLVCNAYTAISDIGITSDEYGKLTLKSTDLQSALTSNAPALVLFAGVTTTTNLSDNTDATGLADILKSTIDTYQQYFRHDSGKENRLDDSLDDIADDRLDIAARMSALEERYTRQFTAMDTLRVN